jgi:quercetin dioxygenase-like cupin family protein
MDTRQGSLIVGPGDGRLIDIGGLGVHFKVRAAATAGGISIVEHPMEAGRLVPPHIHRGEDELSYVLEGTFGVRVGDEVADAGPGSYIFKPRNVPHTFWNAGPGPARLMEIIQPAGFEDFFEKLGEAAQTASSPEEFDATRTRLGAQYNLAFVPEWIEELKVRYGLKLLGEP